MATSRKLSLPVKILIGMALGIVVGIAYNKFSPSQEIMRELLGVRLFDLGGTLFLNMFRMIVVPVVLVSMMRGVTAMNNPALLGRVGLKTVIIFAVTTVLSSVMGIAASFAIGIGKGCSIALPEDSGVKLEGTISSFSDTLASLVPSNLFTSLVDANMLQIIFIAVAFGIALAKIQDKVPKIMALLEEIDALNVKVVEMILCVAPYGVFCLLANTFSNFGAAVLLPLGKYIICFLLVLAVLLFVVYPILILCLARLSPVTFYKKFAPVMLLAFSTSSSNATLPSNIGAVTDLLGVDRSISTFILSLGATINMNGTAIMQGCAAVLIAQLYGIDLTLGQITQIILMCLLASVGTAGMPGAGVIMLGLVLQSVGLPLGAIGLVLGVDRIVDMFRTVGNITGDAVTALVVGASEKALDREIYARPQ